MKAKRMKEKTKKYKNQNIINFILILLICIFVYCAFQVGLWLKSNFELAQIENSFSELAVVIDNNDEAESEEQNQLNVDFIKLQEINSDVIGWIRIQNTNINYPILQGETDEYYLRRDIYGRYSIAGNIFIETATSPDFTDENTVIFGHNLKNNKMFSDLTKIYNGELGKDINVEIYTKTSKYNYKVISAYMEEQDLGNARNNFNQNKKEKEEYIDASISKSNQKFNINNELDKTNKLLTLITCDRTGKKRIIVNAIKE